MLMNSLVIWFILRIFSSILAGFVSFLRPTTLIETSIKVFPPSVPIGQWLDRVFLSPWMRWDALWYQQIVTQGYSAKNGTAQFHPLYPWLATPISKIGVSPALSLLIITTIAGILLFIFFSHFAQLDLPTKDASFALILFTFAPVAFILFAPYPEALFLLLAVLCIIFTRKKSWWLAGLMGGLAALTRQQGVLLFIPVAWELWASSDHKPSNMLKHWRDWLALVLIPLGLVLWILYRAFFLNDLHANVGNFQSFIYSIIVSPAANKVVPVQQFIWPWQALCNSFVKLFTQPDWDIVVNLVAGLLFLVLLAISWNKMRLGYRLYSFAITWVSFSYYTGPIHPYMGLPRHLFLAFPLFVGLSQVIFKPWLRLLLIALSALAMSFLLVLYVLEVWVP